MGESSESPFFCCHPGRSAGLQLLLYAGAGMTALDEIMKGVGCAKSTLII